MPGRRYSGFEGDLLKETGLPESTSRPRKKTVGTTFIKTLGQDTLRSQAFFKNRSTGDQIIAIGFDSSVDTQNAEEGFLLDPGDVLIIEGGCEGEFYAVADGAGAVLQYSEQGKRRPSG